MTIIKIILSLSVLGIFTLGFTTTDVSIDTQIQTIQNAPASERVRLMNAFKIHLSNMNEQDRSDAIAQMRSRTPSKSDIGEMNHEQMQVNNEQMQEHASEIQMEHTQEISRTQNMNQQQVASQFGHENERSGGSVNIQNIPSAQNIEGGESRFGERH